MPTTTRNLGLKKPLGSETFNRQAYNENLDLMDQNAAKKTDLDEHLANDVNHIPYAVATGSANSYVIILNPVPTAYMDGMAVAVKINIASTGASTLNVNGLGAREIKDSLGNAIAPGGLKANIIYSMRYETTSRNFIVQGKGGGGNATSFQLLSGYTATVDTGPVTGTMPNNGALNYNPSTARQSVPAGYTTGGTVNPVTGTATITQVLSGLTFASASGINLTGTMPNLGSPTLTPGSPIPAGYYSGGLVSYPTHGSQTYTSGSGYFTVPPGVNKITFIAVGGGGGGGGSCNYQYQYGGSGGGAGGIYIGILSVTPGEQISYYVGIGGTGGLAGVSYNAGGNGQGGTGSAGGNTTVSSYTAYGGGGGGGNNNATGPGPVGIGGNGGGNGGNGGNGVAGTVVNTWGAGGAGGPVFNSAGAGGKGSDYAAGSVGGNGAVTFIW